MSENENSNIIKSKPPKGTPINVWFRVAILIVIMTILASIGYFVGTMFGNRTPTEDYVTNIVPNKPLTVSDNSPELTESSALISAIIAKLNGTVQPTTPEEIQAQAEAMIEQAIWLYDYANYLDQMLDYRFYYSYCPTLLDTPVVGLNKVDLHRYEIKNKNEYFKVEYRVKREIPLFTMLPTMEADINKSLKLVLAERWYANLGAKKAYNEDDEPLVIYQEVANSKMVSSAKGDIMVPSADFSEKAVTDNMKGKKYTNYTPKNGKSKYPDGYTVPAFTASQYEDEDYYYTRLPFVVDLDTVLSATVAPSVGEDGLPDGGLKVTMVLDTDNYDATEFALEGIKEGTKDPNSRFTSIEFDFTVWDTGYYKYFNETERWEATISVPMFGNLGMSSLFKYQDIYRYDYDSVHDTGSCSVKNNPFTVDAGLFRSFAQGIWKFV